MRRSPRSTKARAKFSRSSSRARCSDDSTDDEHSTDPPGPGCPAARATASSSAAGAPVVTPFERADLRRYRTRQRGRDVQLLDGCIVIGPKRDAAALHALATVAVSLELYRRQLGYGAVRESPDLAFDRSNVRTPAIAFFTGDVGHSPILVVDAMNANEQLGVMRAKLERYLDFGVPTALGLNPQSRQVLVRTLDGRSESVERGELRLRAPLANWDLTVEVLWPSAQR